MLAWQPLQSLGPVAVLTLLAGCAIQNPRVAASNATPDHAVLIDEIRAGMTMIPAGRFQMGNPPNASQTGVAEDEHPQHEVTLRSFRLGRFEVAAAHFAEFARATGRTAPVQSSDGKYPAINVSWHDAQLFIQWLNAVSGERYRLPTEAEWEYAARAGSTAAYPWGETFDATQLNGTGLHGRDQWLETAPLGQFAANAFGVYDMLGNVWEWTQDCYRPDYEGASADGSPREEESGCGRVLRGGSWSDRAEWLRPATRNWFDAGERFDYVGFRLAAD